jgi:archaeal flagellin FlaB
MLKKLTGFLYKPQKGITGIETAIILIAFVVVAAVFAYVAISSGMFATQKSQEAIYKGIQSAEGSVVVKGGMVTIAETPGATGAVSQITFSLTPAMRGNPIDFTPPLASAANNGFCDPASQNMVVISYMDSTSKVDNLFWTVQKCGYAGSDNLLDENELFQITIGAAVSGANGGTDGGNLADALAGHPLSVNSTFTIQVTTGGTGSTLVMERTTPAYIDGVMNLH